MDASCRVPLLEKSGDSCNSGSASFCNTADFANASPGFVLDVIVESRECDKFGSSSVGVARDRHQRYAQAQSLGDVPSESSVSADKILRARGAFSILLFLDSSLQLATLVRLVDWGHYVSFFVLLVPHCIVVLGQMVAAFLDPVNQVLRRRCYAQSCCVGFFVDAMYLGLVLGVFQVYSVVRARRFFGANGRRGSVQAFVDSLSEYDFNATRSDGDSFRIDNHFVSAGAVAYVYVLSNLLILRLPWPSIGAGIVLTTLVVSSITLITSICIFDYRVSRSIRRCFEGATDTTWLLFVSWRVVEVLSRILFHLIPGLLVSEGRTREAELVFAVCLLDYIVVAVFLARSSLRCTAGSPSPLSIMLLLVMAWASSIAVLCRYIDEMGFVLPARKLTALFTAMRHAQGIAVSVLLLLPGRFVLQDFFSANHGLPVPAVSTLDVCFACAVMACHALQMCLCRRGSSELDDLPSAAHRGDSKLLQVLCLENPGLVNARLNDMSRRTPLHIAASHGHHSCASTLLSFDAEGDAQDADLDNALHIACRRMDEELITMLLDQHHDCEASEKRKRLNLAQLEQTNMKGQTPLQILIDRKAPEKLRILLEEAVAEAQRQTCPELRLPRPGLMPSAPRSEKCTEQELYDLFGMVHGDLTDSFDSSSEPRDAGALSLLSLMLSRGVGDHAVGFHNAFVERIRALMAGRKSSTSEVLHVASLQRMRSLGCGSFGKVIQVQDARTGRDFAMKLQRKDRAAKQAMREALTMASVHRHRYVVKLIRVFNTKPFYAILMELCESDLNERLVTTSGLEIEKVARYTACMALALEYLHSTRIIFRDLKPQNVLITFARDGDYAKLADFGLARSLEGEHQLFQRAASFGLTPVRSRDGAPDEALDAFSMQCGTPAFTPIGVGAFVFNNDDEDASQAETCAQPPSREDWEVWELARDWYGVGCCLLLMCLGEDVARLLGTPNAFGPVLRPPRAQLMEQAMDELEREGGVDADVLETLRSLTCASAVQRARAADLRGQAFLRKAMVDLDVGPMK
eukprot:TRINITY_DN20772_c0_g7_i1.p1 TRINITY_DN20772_c0_g7~~TRINITY_DN20772_c0_g7_i1.p1  ORF type:complete len:1047 (+),score=161.60 TRINITY_DN20772_c0_g7_i1:52-3141(+)